MSLGDLLSDGGVLSLDLGLSGALSDFLVDLLVEGFHVGDLGGVEVLGPSAELLLELGGVVLLELVHVGLDVETEDVLSVFLGVVSALGLAFLDDLASLSCGNGSLLEVVAWESLGVVGDVDASVNSALHGSEHSVSSGGSDETNVEKSLERSSVFVDAFFVDVEELSVGFNTLVDVSHAEGSEESSGAEETSSVGGSVVGVTSFESESSELLGISLAEHLVSLDGSVDDLSDDSSVGSSDAESVLLGVVLVLVLLDESSSGEVVGLSFSSASELDLVSGVVRRSLDGLDECHSCCY